MSQYARPETEISAGTWSPSGTLVENINEATADDATTRITATSNGTCTIDMTTTLLDPIIHTGHVFRVRARNNGIPVGAPSLTVGLSSDGNAVFSGESFSLTENWQTFERALTEVEAAIINDYGLLRFTIQSVATETSDVTWVEFEVPDVGGGRKIAASRRTRAKGALRGRGVAGGVLSGIPRSPRAR